MLFHYFKSQDERRKFGGSCFLEFQYCTLNKDADLKEIVSVDTIKHWYNSSLYLHGDDMDEFWDLYKEIFLNGCYSNGRCGIVDMYGINYYSPEETTRITRCLMEQKPKDYQRLLDWLGKVTDFNGFYILGV